MSAQKVKKFIIVIPSLNPANELLELVKLLLSGGENSVIIVNDGSDAEYGEIFSTLSKETEVVVLKHSVNQGKGRALKTAYNYILNNFAVYSNAVGVITVDCDGQHNIEDIEKCEAALERHTAENSIILGCRHFGRDAKIPFRSRFGNKCTRIVLRYLCNINVSDSQTGLRAFPMHMLPRLMSISGEQYEYETNMLLELAEDSVKIIEVPICTIYENNNSLSHFNPLRDSAKIYGVILKYSMASVLSASLDYMTFAILSPHCSNVWILTFAGRAISAIFNFTINKKVVFRSPGKIWQQVLKYLMLLIISGSISAFFVYTIHAAFAANVIFIKLVVELSLYFLNFYVQKNYIFSKRRGEDANKNK